MKNLFKNRIFIFVLGLLIPIVIVAMIVYFFGEDEEVFEINVDDFTIEDNTIINEKEGLRITIPEDWTFHKKFDTIFAASPDIEFEDNGSLIYQSIKDGGCLIGIDIKKYNKDSLNYVGYTNLLINQVKDGNFDDHAPKHEVILIDGREGLLITYTTENEEVAGITLEIPVDNTLYSFDSGKIFNEKCVDYFYKNIETILIKK